MQETASQMNMMRSGRMSAPSTESLKVWTQRKVMTGAASMFSLDQYPVAPEMAHPTARPRMMEADFISGEPNCSTMMTVTKTLKPRPMSFGSPLKMVSTLLNTYGGVGDLPWQRLRSRNIGAHSIETFSSIAIAASTPILHSAVDEIHTHKQQQTSSHDLWEDLVQFLGWNH